MKKQHFPDLTAEQLDDGTIHLEQEKITPDGEAQWCSIGLHPDQLTRLAKSFLPCNTLEAEKIATLERRLQTVTSALSEFAEDSIMRSQIIKYCGHGFEYLTRLDSLVMLSGEFCADLNMTPPEISNKSP